MHKLCPVVHPEGVTESVLHEKSFPAPPSESVQFALKVTALPTFTGSGESVAKVIFGAVAKTPHAITNKKNTVNRLLNFKLTPLCKAKSVLHLYFFLSKCF